MKNINVKIEFVDGKVINLELYPSVAPITVENFVTLARSGFYDGLCFHRIIPNFMIQGGGFVYSKGLIPKKAASIKGEFSANNVNNTLHHEAGVISMARTNVYDSASSQFFICVADCDFLDGQYAAFGKTRDDVSLSNAIELSKVPTGSWMYYNDVPIEPIVIKTVTVED